MVYDLTMKDKSSIVKKNGLYYLNFRRIIRICIESLLWIMASILASLIRYDGLISKDKYINVLFLGILGSFVYLLNNIIVNL